MGQDAEKKTAVSSHGETTGYVKIIQLLVTENNANWQGRLLGLGNNGVTYEVDTKGRWVPFIPPLT